MTTTALSPNHLPNTLAHEFALHGGTKVTLYKAVPGDTAPRMQMQILGGNPVDCGPVESPERFGAYSTPAEFKAWCRTFANEA